MKPKTLRKALRHTASSRIAADKTYFDELFNRIFKMPLLERLRIAWSVAKGRW